MALSTRGGGGAPRRGGDGQEASGQCTKISSPCQNGNKMMNLTYSASIFLEQIKVSTEGRNTIRVRGERLVAGNKWNRFQEDYQVPENGEMNSIRAKFQGGILKITVPRKGVDKPQETLTPKPKITDVQKQPTPLKKDQGRVFPQASTSQPTDEKSTEQQKTSVDPSTKHGQNGDQKQATPQKGQDKAFPAAGTRQSAGEKSIEPQNASDDYRKKHDDITQFRNESKEKNIASERPDDVTTKMVEKEKKNVVGSKELPDSETAKKTSKKDGGTGIPEKKADNKEVYGAFTKEKYKKAVKGLTELNEERQLLVNMGVAMLVIVALTAYATYKFASGKDKN
ncbi:hypothetical protein DH2020_045413 [Rehmannia glutinosa]|uniref:SHSP domain-containing protein n=1 Tax=Rehmannia glutinosa TaxID=99300 RepID=A0ABR0UEX1_REHGL